MTDSTPIATMAPLSPIIETTLDMAVGQHVDAWDHHGPVINSDPTRVAGSVWGLAGHDQALPRVMDCPWMDEGLPPVDVQVQTYATICCHDTDPADAARIISRIPVVSLCFSEGDRHTIPPMRPDQCLHLGYGMLDALAITGGSEQDDYVGQLDQCVQTITTETGAGMVLLTDNCSVVSVQQRVDGGYRDVSETSGPIHALPIWGLGWVDEAYRHSVLALLPRVTGPLYMIYPNGEEEQVVLEGWTPVNAPGSMCRVYRRA